jgi:hypothetical protein
MSNSIVTSEIHEPDLDLDREQRAAYVKRLRENVDRAALGLPTRGGRVRGMTQLEVVTALGNPVGERQWRNLERCERPWPRQIADGYARLLRLQGRDLRMFYSAVGHRRAAVGASRELTDFERIVLSRTFSRCTPWYICDELWDVRACNKAMTRIVPQLIPGVNLMEFVLTHPAARRLLMDWHDRWATPMVHQLRSTLSAAVGARREGLLALARDLCAASAEVAQIWGREFDTRLSPNGDRRALRPADPDSPDGLGPAVDIMLYGMAPLNRPEWRAMWVMQLDHECELCRPVGYDDGERWFPPAPPSPPGDPAVS